MSLEYPILFAYLQKARGLARDFVNGEELEITEHTLWDLQIKNALHYLRSKEGKALLKRFTLPVANRYVETLIRRSLALPDKARLENSHLREAIVSALLYPLRQVVGSCFATAPAIYIQQEQPERLLLDLYDLLMLGKLKRTFGGSEYNVPISPKWGERASDHPLLRVWEYTLASFADYKTTFSQWNMYQSLGLDPQHEGGIGELLYRTLQTKLEETNAEVEKLHNDYARAIDEARVSQALLRQADSADRMRLRKGELEVRLHHADTCKDLRDRMQQRGENLASFFSFLIKEYHAQFLDYFIEIFDPQALEIHEALLEDSPAGFRLLYKHGRSDPSAWTPIENEKGFVDVLQRFFLAVEPHLSAVCEWEEGEKEIELLTTQVIHYIHTEEFLAFALRKKRKPWRYTSGGSLHTLLKGYYCIEGELAEEKRPISNPTDLLIFLLDLLKALPYHVTKAFEENSIASLIMYSPTHAFLLKPGLSPFREGWLDKGFTYTWVRDHVIDPAKNFLASIRLDRESQTLIANKVIEKDFYPYPGTVTLPEFRNHLVKLAPQLHEAIDNLLFQTFPTNPLHFADSNWADYSFAFAVNPATLELDLYRVSLDRTRAYPMTPWRPYLDGTTDQPWGVLIRPSDLKGTVLADLALKLKKI